MFDPLSVLGSVMNFLGHQRTGQASSSTAPFLESFWKSSGEKASAPVSVERRQKDQLS